MMVPWYIPTETGRGALGEKFFFWNLNFFHPRMLYYVVLHRSVLFSPQNNKHRKSYGPKCKSVFFFEVSYSKKKHLSVLRQLSSNARKFGWEYNFQRCSRARKQKHPVRKLQTYHTSLIVRSTRAIPNIPKTYTSTNRIFPREPLERSGSNFPKSKLETLAHDSGAF